MVYLYRRRLDYEEPQELFSSETICSSQVGHKDNDEKTALCRGDPDRMGDRLSVLASRHTHHSSSVVWVLLEGGAVSVDAVLVEVDGSSVAEHHGGEV